MFQRKINIIILIAVVISSSIMPIVSSYQDDEREYEKGWSHPYYDSTCSNYYPSSTTTHISNNAFIEKWSETVTVDRYGSYVLTGDVQGNEMIEIIVSDLTGALKAYDGNGNQLWNYHLSIDDRPAGSSQQIHLSLLADVNGDTKKEIFVGGRNSEGIPTIWVLNGDGTLLKTISYSGADDSGMYPRDIDDYDQDGDMEILVTFDSGYGRNPRGAGLIDYNSGTETWHYEIGPRCLTLSSFPVADIDNDNTLEMIFPTFTPHNGHSGNGQGMDTTTNDGQKYTIVIDENGNEEFTVQGFAGNTDGRINHYITDLNHDGNKEIIAFDLRYSVYGGYNYIYMRNPFDGTILKTYVGPKDTIFRSCAIANIDNEEGDEIVVTNDNGSVTILDHTLIPTYISSGYTEPLYNVKLNDYNGDGSLEIIISDDDTVRVLDNQLDELWNYQLGGEIYNIIPSDVTGDGVNELIVVADHLYVLETSDTIQESIQDNSLVSYWSFDEGEDNIAYDSVGDNNGIIYGDPEWVSGISNSALKFDGYNDYLKIEDENINIDNQFSIETWIYPESYAYDSINPMFIICKRTGNLDSYALSLNNSGNVIFSKETGTSGYDVLYSKDKVEQNQWSHLLATFDGTTMKLYINGVLDNSISKTEDTIIGEGDLYIGANTELDNYRFYKGFVDELKIYNYALSESEIESLYDSYTNLIPSLKEKPTIDNLFDMDDITDTFDHLDSLFNYALKGIFMNVRITVFIENYEIVDNVKCEFNIPTTDNIIEEMHHEGNGKYTIQFMPTTEEDYIVSSINLFLTVTGLGAVFPDFSFTVPPPISIPKLIVTTTESNEYEIRDYMPITLPTMEEANLPGYNPRYYGIQAHCPIDLMVETPSGEKVGAVYENGTFAYSINELTNALYTGPDIEPEFILIYEPEGGVYNTTVNANGNGTYNLSFCQTEDGNVTEQKTYSSVESINGTSSNYSMELKIENVQEKVETPGFGIIVLFVALSFLILYKRKKEKN